VSDEQSFDYVVVGGGSSGCVVAGQLAEDRSLQVALLELGDRAEDHPETLDADGYKHAFANDALLLERFSVPQPSCGNQRLFLGSGRGMGGSGSINGMVYTRGDRADYESWPDGWQYDDVAPFFEGLEKKLRVRPRPATRFTETFIASAEHVGFRRSEDMNDGDLSGVIGYETMNYEGDARRSSYVAFVKDAAARNLTVCPRTRALRVLFEGDRAVGVEVEQDGVRRTIRARREVVLCAGALETPKLLLLSGVGPVRSLGEFGIPLVRDVQGVGKNLHDHPNVALFFLGKLEVDSYYPQLYAFHRANKSSDLPPGQSDTCYVMYPARSSFREAAMRMLPAKLPESLYGGASKRAIRGAIATATRFSGVNDFIARVWGCVVILGKPKSRGTLGLRSRDAADQALIDPAYFAHPEDMRTMLEGVRLAQRIAKAPSLAAWGNTALLPPALLTSDKQLTWFIENNAMTTFHYAGTCRMGEDRDAVVDSELRVRGLRGLRVADASVVPFTPVSAMNAPSMMIGYRAAALIAAEYDGIHTRPDPSAGASARTLNKEASA
jgi:choline dehydrogenase